MVCFLFRPLLSLEELRRLKTDLDNPFDDCKENNKEEDKLDQLISLKWR